MFNKKIGKRVKLEDKDENYVPKAFRKDKKVIKDKDKNPRNNTLKKRKIKLIVFVINILKIQKKMQQSNLLNGYQKI